MIYIIAFEGIQDMERRRLLENAKLKLEETQAINNLCYLGVPLTNASGTGQRKDRYSYWGSHAQNQKKRDASGLYDLSRYVPILRCIMEVL